MRYLDEVIMTGNLILYFVFFLFVNIYSSSEKNSHGKRGNKSYGWKLEQNERV